jgi:hypothetical protein
MPSDADIFSLSWVTKVTIKFEDVRVDLNMYSLQEELLKNSRSDWHFKVTDRRIPSTVKIIV